MYVKFSSTQAISPQYLDVFTSNWLQSFLRCLGFFASKFVIVQAFLKPYTRYLKRTFLVLNRYILSFTTCFIVIRLIVACGKAVATILIFAKQLRFENCAAC